MRPFLAIITSKLKQMKISKNVRFPYYSGNIYQTEVLGHVTLEEFIYAHKYPTQHTEDLLNEIQKATMKKDLQLKRELKQQLFAFTPSVFIEVGLPRKYKTVQHWTGLMQLDFDCIESKSEALLLKRTLFDNHKEIVCAYLSPSGKGVKCLMRINTPRDKDHYKAMHQAMVNTFEEYSYLDLATKNAVLPLFLSADTNILYRDYSECDVWDYEDYTEVEYVALNDKPTNFTPASYSNKQKQYYYDKVVRITTTRINNIIENGHPQVRSTALILGSRVAAGYIDRSDAESLISSLISNNSYLNKNTDGYIRTAMWAIANGMNAPKYF